MEAVLEKLRIEKNTGHQQSGGNKRALLRLLVLIGLLVVLLLTVLIYLKQRPALVEVTTVVSVFPSQGFTVLNASGYVVAARKAAVAAKTTGRLEWLGVEEGSHVRAGDIIARLENRDLVAARDQVQAQVQSAASALEQARAEQVDASQSFSRQNELLHHGIVARADYDATEARHRRAVAGVSGAAAALQAARSALRGAEIALDYSLIRAPFDAVVLTKNADIGDIITPLGAAANAKAAVVTLADLSSLEVEVDVAESNLGQVKPDQPCEVSLDAFPGERFQATVHTIVPTADRSKASVLVKIRFLGRDARILPEMSAKVAFLSRRANPNEQQTRTAVNPAALIIQQGSERVFRIVDGRAHSIPVTRGQKLGELVEVQGLAAGDRVVLRPDARMANNSRVAVREP